MTPRTTAGSRLELLAILAIVLVALAARLLWIRLVPNQPFSDFALYFEIARNVAEGKGHSFLGSPVAFQGMGYPTLLGLFFRFTGHATVRGAEFLNVALSMLTLVPFFVVCRRLLPSPRQSLAAFALLALLPNHVAYTNVIGTEVLTTLLFATAVALQSSERWGHGRCVLLGIVTGLAALTKPYFLLYPAVVAAVQVLSTGRWRRSLARAGMVALIMGVVIAPWTIRNFRTFGQFIPVSYNAGYVLYVNNNPADYTGGNIGIGGVPVPEALRAPFARVGLRYGMPIVEEVEICMREPGLEPLLKRAALHWIMAHPVDFVQLGFIRLRNVLFSGVADIEAWCLPTILAMPGARSVESVRHLELFRSLGGIMVHFFSALGLGYLLVRLPSLVRALGRRERPAVVDALPILNLVFLLAICFVFEGQPRYNHPMLFLMGILMVRVLAAAAARPAYKLSAGSVGAVETEPP